MTTTLKILAVEDVAADAELALRELMRSGIACSMQRVENETQFSDALQSYHPDVILCDFSLPGFDGLSALEIARTTSPDTPFIFVSGTIGEERAISALKLGAADYVLKSNLARLAPAVRRSLHEMEERVARMKAEQALQTERNLLSAVFDTTGALGLMLDIEGRIQRFNHAAERCTGFREQEVKGGLFWELFFMPADAQFEKSRFQTWHTQTHPIQYQNTWLTRTGERREVLWLTTALNDDRGEIVSYISSGIDITRWRQAEDRIHHLNNFDVLTGLPNRSLLLDRLQQAIVRGKDADGLVALLLIGMEETAQVRESLGYHAGDFVITEAAQRLQRWKRDDDTLARFADTNFAVIMENVDQSAITSAIQQILETLSRPYPLPSHSEVYLGARIGIAIYPNDADATGPLLQAGEVALRRAAMQTYERYQFYTAAFNQQAAERLKLTTRLRQALHHDELLLHYQPQVDIRSGRIVGFEALLRWNHPEKGMVPPMEFIPLAEETGLIIPIGEWVLRTACLQNKLWQDMGLPAVTVAVNLSSVQFAQKNLCDVVRAALDRTGLEPKYLELELTESASMESPETSIQVMNAIRALGVRISIDDFGTGYSNLNYLKRFPVDLLKLDQSFVREITSDPDDLAISKAVIAMAHNLRLEVIAEGVETEGQLAVLRANGCDRMQGFHFSRPLPSEQCTDLLDKDVMLAPATALPDVIRPTLLLVDDEPNVLSSLKRALRGSHYEILSAHTAAEAFELMASYRVGVILSDQRMPALNGTEFLNRVKDMYPETVRIVLSGYTDLATVTEAVNRSAIYKFLTKPWEEDDLRQSLKEAFEKYEADRKPE